MKLIEERLSQFSSDTLRRELDADTLHLLKRNILDSFAGICGSMHDTAMLQKFDRMIDIADKGAEITVWGTGRRGTHADVFFLNTILGRRSDLLNTYFSPNNMGVAHPSDNVSLVLTLADWLGKSGRDVLSLTHLAYLLAGVYADYFAPEAADYDHDAAAVFYTTLVIGCALGLSVDELTNAQRVAGGLGLDTNQSALDRVTDWKHCTYASCALRGLFAAKMAKAGIEGPYAVYQGTAGVERFFPHAAGILDPMPDIRSVVFKRWPALVFCQTPIDVALDIAPKIKDASSIARVNVKTYKMAADVGAGKTAYNPDSRAGRTHSIPYCVAAVLLEGRLSYEFFDEPFAGKKPLAELMAKISVETDKTFTSGYPARSPCRITVTLADGTKVESARDYPRGDPKDPLSDAELEDKLKEYFFFARDKKEVASVIDRLWNLEQELSIDWLVEPLKRRRV